MYTKQKHYEGGSKHARFLAFKLRKQQADNTVYSIKDPVTKQTHHDIDNIKSCFKLFYEKLYTQLQVDNDSKMDDFLKSVNLPVLSETQNNTLMSAITTEEVKNAITRQKTNRSPGPDGYTAQWYKTLRDVLTPILVKTFNWVLQTKETPISWREAIISVIPKPGKDKSECTNYRPISVLNLDNKLFTSIFAKRFDKILPQIIHLDQTEFIQSRQTQDNIRRTLQINRNTTQNNLQAMIVSLDAEKAFDSVRWTFLFKVMEKCGFNETIIQTIETLYKNPSARLKINGELSESFILEQSTRQGCPLSPLLFAIFIEPLAQGIRQNEAIEGIKMVDDQKLALFTDDVLVYLCNPTRSLPALMTCLNEYGSFSGYKLNVQKHRFLGLITILLLISVRNIS